MLVIIWPTDARRQTNRSSFVRCRKRHSALHMDLNKAAIEKQKYQQNFRFTYTEKTLLGMDQLNRYIYLLLTLIFKVKKWLFVSCVYVYSKFYFFLSTAFLHSKLESSLKSTTKFQAFHTGHLHYLFWPHDYLSFGIYLSKATLKVSLYRPLGLQEFEAFRISR
jgi:hypothetical protein